MNLRNYLETAILTQRELPLVMGISTPVNKENHMKNFVQIIMINRNEMVAI